MKINNIIISAFLASGMTACTNDEASNDGGTDKMPISLQASSVASRAYTTGDIDTEEAMRDGSFGAVGYSSNAIVFGSASKGISHSYANGGWDYTKESDIQYWGGRTINFYAYFPYSITATTFADSDASGNVMTLSGWTDKQDVLYARSLSKTTEISTPLEFHHAFAKIDKIHVTVPSDLTFIIKEVEVTNTHTETDGTITLSTSGEATCTAGKTQVNRNVTLASEKSVSKNDDSGVDIVTSTDNAFFFPVTATNDVWDGSTTGTDICKKKLTIHLKAKVLQGSETVLKGEYVLGSATEWADIYLPVKTSNTTQTFDRDKKYTINYALTKGVGYDKDGNTYKPIELTVTVSDWTNNDVSVGQITVSNYDLTYNSAAESDNSIIINASDVSKLSATVSSDLQSSISASIQQDTDTKKKIRLVITKLNEYTSGKTGTIIINDQTTNSMVTINVTLG